VVSAHFPGRGISGKCAETGFLLLLRQFGPVAASFVAYSTQLNFMNTFAARKLNCSIQKQYLKVTTKQKTIYQSITTVQSTVAATNHRITNEVRAYSTLSPASTEMGDRLRAGISPRYVTMPTTSTQPCIPPGSLNRVPAIIGSDKGGNVTSAG